MIQERKKTFFEQYEFIIPLGLFLLFLALTLPGISSWGGWHPDEIVIRSINALHGEWKFSETNFDYPDLPQYAMFWLGKIILALGYTDTEILTASRFLSAVLAGLTIILIYIIARRMGGSVPVAGLSGLLLVSVSEMEHNGRFAHNDTYLIFFTTLAVLFLLEYNMRQNKAWLYASFISVGMAVSSKFTGGSLIIAPFVVYLIGQRGKIRTELLAIMETLFISVILTFLSFAFGTPKALFWMTFYFKRLLPTLQWQTAYGRQPDSVRGILGQYGVMANGLGLALVLLFGIAFVWTIWTVSKAHRNNTLTQEPQKKSFAILLLAILVLDLPMTISYNYQLRYFLTLMPFLAILAAFFIEKIYQWAKAANKTVYPIVVSVMVSAIILYSIARVVSLMLLFVNDARIPASAFLDTLPTGTSLEATLYPPTLPEKHFSRQYNYPIYFIKVQGDPLPTSKNYEFNVGEIGLDERKTDYLVVDSFTSDKFKNAYTCQTMQVECDFFKQLATGQSNHYKLIAEFSYSLPAYLPKINVLFVNPSIRIFERIK